MAEDLKTPPNPHCSWCGLPISVTTYDSTEHWYMPNGLLAQGAAWHLHCHRERVEELKKFKEKE